MSLLETLELIWEWEKEPHIYPVFYNSLMIGGYIEMPSAQMNNEGTLGVGFASNSPYRYYSVAAQPYPLLELSVSYRVFVGIPDCVFGDKGYGDQADRGFNFKLAVLRAEDSEYVLPGIAVGMEDATGTSLFLSRYVVATQIFPSFNLECSLGWGSGRIHGLFGGAMWVPWRTQGPDFLRNLALVAEYDAIDYDNPKREPHPDGRSQKSKINGAIKYRLFEVVDTSISYIRGECWAATINAHYNLGDTHGWLPKMKDAPYYAAPINQEPLNTYRPHTRFISEVAYALKDQGLRLIDGHLSPAIHPEREDFLYDLHLEIENPTYRSEVQVHERIAQLLAYLTPQNISRIYVVLVDSGIPVLQYTFRNRFFQDFTERRIGLAELSILSMPQDPSPFIKNDAWLIYRQNPKRFSIAFTPNYQTYFGSSQGKFKYDLGAAALCFGTLPGNIYYQTVLTMTMCSSKQNSGDFDTLNPSQLDNLISDSVRYHVPGELSVDQLYLEKNCDLGHKWFGRASVGYFQVEFGGFAGELLYYPVNSHLAVGFSGAVLKKRCYEGLRFTDTLRHFDGFTPVYRHYNWLQQYFVDFYYDLPQLQTELSLSPGRFLAGDYGARCTWTRYFSNGFQLFAWYTWTNGHDKVNGKIYHDKGIGLSIPLDFFAMRSKRSRFTYSISAWLRDVGVRSATGRPLYTTLRDQRRL